MTCGARVSEPPWYVHHHVCSRSAKETFQGYPVCGTHLRVARKWDEQGRFVSMAQFNRWAPEARADD